jgi:hypothetical protein
MLLCNVGIIDRHEPKLVDKNLFIGCALVYKQEIQLKLYRTYCLFITSTIPGACHEKSYFEALPALAYAHFFSHLYQFNHT